MTERVMDTRAFPDVLFDLITTERVKVNQVGGVVSLTPVAEEDDDCPLLGIAADWDITVDEFLSRRREEKVLEGE